MKAVSASKPIYSPPEPITTAHRLDGFVCGKPPLDDWLIARALKSEAKSARTYVVVSRAGPNSGRVIAYYALATGSVAREEVPKNIRHGLPNPTPVLVLARLAVDEQHGGKGVGSALLKDAMLRTLEISRAVGDRALIVHAIDDAAVNFYAKYGFQVFPTGAKAMFLPIETLVQALGSSAH